MINALVSQTIKAAIMPSMVLLREKVGVVGMPFYKGQPKAGTHLAPNLLRQSGIIERISSTGCEVVDHGDLVVDDVSSDESSKKVARPRNVGLANKKLADTVEKIVNQRQTCLVLGGDHSIAMGSIHGHLKAEPDVVVVWVDAHADINTPLTSPSGNLHGMPLSFLVKELAPHMPVVPGFEWLKPCISAKDIVYIGLRDVDSGEKAIIDKFGIPSFSMQEIDQLGIGEVMERALRSVDPKGRRPIHVSFDVDAIEPALIPSTGTPVPGGLSLRESLFIAEEIARTGMSCILENLGHYYYNNLRQGRLSVLDCVEVNPLLGSKKDQERTVDTTIQVIGHFFGNKREGSVPKEYTLPVA